MPAEGTMGHDAPSPTRSPSRAATALVFAGGDRPSAVELADLPESSLVIAADSGVEHARALGYRVDLVVGDLDSADPLAVEAAVAGGAEVERHPAAKDATDLELALLAAQARGADDVVVVGGHGGRLDHFLANALLLTSAEFATLHLRARMGGAELTVVRDRAELAGGRGALCSLLPVGGPAYGVRTEGLRYPLDHETLHAGSTRGVSNEFLGTTATIALDTGVLLAVVPHPRKAS
jgi:thiamine pyrophosphokinase